MQKLDVSKHHIKRRIWNLKKNKCLPISVTKYKTNKTIVVLKFTFLSCEFPTMVTDLAHSDIFYNVKFETSFFTKGCYYVKIFFRSFSFSKIVVEVFIVYDQSIAIVYSMFATQFYKNIYNNVKHEQNVYLDLYWMCNMNSTIMNDNLQLEICNYQFDKNFKAVFKYIFSLYKVNYLIVFTCFEENLKWGNSGSEEEQWRSQRR